mmetsp:Transcript_3923/g.11410  ORF Transcript_3923/g.11410 Transcript_3923/m.11410 type:complete len:110 (+) Transcript_3923:233-562(+)
MGEDEEAPVDSKKDRESAAAAASLDKLTDHVEEREVDVSKAQNAMNKLAEAQTAAKEQQQARDRQLRQVKVSAGDVELIAVEFEVDKKRAELRLREHDGDVKGALRSFL